MFYNSFARCNKTLKVLCTFWRENCCPRSLCNWRKKWNVVTRNVTRSPRQRFRKPASAKKSHAKRWYGQVKRVPRILHRTAAWLNARNQMPIWYIGPRNQMELYKLPEWFCNASHFLHVSTRSQFATHKPLKGQIRLRFDHFRNTMSHNLCATYVCTFWRSFRSIPNSKHTTIVVPIKATKNTESRVPDVGACRPNQSLTRSIENTNRTRNFEHRNSLPELCQSSSNCKVPPVLGTVQRGAWIYKKCKSWKTVWS